MVFTFWFIAFTVALEISFYNRFCRVPTKDVGICEEMFVLYFHKINLIHSLQFVSSYYILANKQLGYNRNVRENWALEDWGNVMIPIHLILTERSLCKHNTSYTMTETNLQLPAFDTVVLLRYWASESEAWFKASLSDHQRTAWSLATSYSGYLCSLASQRRMLNYSYFRSPTFLKTVQEAISYYTGLPIYFHLPTLYLQYLRDIQCDN